MDNRPNSGSWFSIAPRRPVEWLVLAAVLGVLLWLGFAGYRRYQDRQARRHPEAMVRWLELARNDFQGASRSELRATFLDCFRKGDPASLYEAQLATASLKIVYPGPPPTTVTYSWHLEGASEQGDCVYDVLVEGDPPVIQLVFLNPILH
jgi:hypothetical protein